MSGLLNTCDDIWWFVILLILFSLSLNILKQQKVTTKESRQKLQNTPTKNNFINESLHCSDRVLTEKEEKPMKKFRGWFMSETQNFVC